MSSHAGMIDLGDMAKDIAGLSIRASQIETITVTHSVLYKESTTHVRLIGGRSFELIGDHRASIINAMVEAGS